jgi:hypothetical protein
MGSQYRHTLQWPRHPTSRDSGTSSQNNSHCNRKVQEIVFSGCSGTEAILGAAITGMLVRSSLQVCVPSRELTVSRQGPRRRTLHLYVVRAANLAASLLATRPNAETHLQWLTFRLSE